MITLDDTTKDLEVVLGGAVTTNELPLVSTYVDYTSTSYVPTANTDVSNGTTPVAIVSAPGSNTYRQVKFLSIHNADTASATVTLQYDDNTTKRTIVKVALDVGDNLIYTDGEGFRVIDSTGKVKGTGGGGTSDHAALSNLDWLNTAHTGTANRFPHFDGSGNAEEIAETGSGSVVRATSPTLSSPVLTTPQINDTSSDHQYIVGVSELAADRTVTLPLLTGNDTFVFASHTATLTNKTLTSPVLTTPQINDTSLDHQYVFAVSELTADRTVTLPLLTGNDTFVFNAFAATLTNKTIDADNNTITNIGSSEIVADIVTGLTEEGSPTSGDFLLGVESGGALRKIDIGNLPSSGINNVVEDTTPQLGGDLDTNSSNIQFDDAHGIYDDSGNEHLIFQKVTSAVNYLEITHSATGVSPTFRSVGDDANIDLVLSGKGTGIVKAGGVPVVTTTGVQTLSNKTLTNPSINDTSADHIYLLQVSELTASRNITLPLLTSNDTFVFQAHSQTLTNKTIDADNNTVTNIGSSEIKAEMVTGLTEEASPTSGDFLLGVESGGALRKIDVGNLPSSGIANVVEDTTPQLGGDLDTNSFNIQFDDAHGIFDDSGNEHILFQKTASAVNYLDVTNAATGNGVSLGATGSDTDVDLLLTAKGAGVVKADGVEVATLSVTQTLTNKTLTSPVLTTPQINDTSADHQYVFAVSELTADRTVTLPLLTGNDTFVFNAFAATLTNKTIDADNNTITNIGSSEIVADIVTGLTEEASPTSGDFLLAVESGGALRKIDIGNLPGGGITSLGGETGATQTFADVDDTNVTLTISSATNTHTFTMGWSGTLAGGRGGLGADASSWNGFAKFTSGTASELKSEFAKTGAPGSTDDDSAGYAVGSRWLDTTNDKEYVCLDATTVSAVWTETTNSNNALLDGNAHNDTSSHSVSEGDLVIGGASSWDGLAIGGANEILVSNGTTASWGAVPSNVLLDGSRHSDTVSQTVSRGSLIYGNSTPAWDELTLGAAGHVLVSDGTDAAWAEPSDVDTVANLSSVRDGKLGFPNNGFSLYRDNGSNLIPWGPLFPFTDPVDGDFAWINQNNATVSATKGGVYLEQTTTIQSSAYNYNIRKKSALAAPYTVDFAFLCNFDFISTGYGVVGPCWRQSSDGKLVSVAVWMYDNTSSNLQIIVTKMNSETSYSASYGTGRLHLQFGILWFRLEDDNTNRKVYCSADGQNWILLHSVGRTDFMTADEIGFFVQAYSAACDMTLLHWKEG